MNHSFSHMFEVKKFYNIKETPEGVAEGAERPQSPAEQLADAQKRVYNFAKETRDLEAQGLTWGTPEYEAAQAEYRKSLDKSQEVVREASDNVQKNINDNKKKIDASNLATPEEKNAMKNLLNNTTAALEKKAEQDKTKTKERTQENLVDGENALGNSLPPAVDIQRGDGNPPIVVTEGDEYPTPGTLTAEQAAKEVRAEADALRNKTLKENVAKAQAKPTEAGAEGGATATAAATEGGKNEDSFIQKREDGSEFAARMETKQDLQKHSLSMKNLEFTPEGNLSDKDLSKFLANFDDDNNVEVQNVSWAKRVFK